MGCLQRRCGSLAAALVADRDACPVLELFSDRARQVVVQASDAARTLGHGFIGAEHLLLGVIAEGHGVGARVLESLGVTDEAVRRELLLRDPQPAIGPARARCRSRRRRRACWSARSLRRKTLR